MAIWREYLEQAGPGEPTATGNLRMWPDLWSPQLENNRDILVYLPPSYEANPDRRYPVIYMLYVEDPGGIHHESAWARRLSGALRFLLG